MKFVKNAGVSSFMVVLTVVLLSGIPGNAEASPSSEQATLRAALDHLVSDSAGPPGAIAVVQHGATPTAISAGAADFANPSAAPSADDHIRVASVAKAFSGAVALALVARHTLALNDTIEKWLPDLPKTWGAVTLGELLNHTSGIPDFSDCPQFREAVFASLLDPPTPEALLAYVERPPCYAPPHFTPGTKYGYSNSDNVIVGLMIQAATKQDYSVVLSQTVSHPLGLSGTSLPTSATVPNPVMHGYVPDPTEAPLDVTEHLAAGWSWASGGVVSTPADANKFIRGYVRGATTNAEARAKQFRFVEGKSEPPGPGTNAAGMAIFRYQTDCGTVFGHTGNTLGYTQFIAASANGQDSVSITVSSQITPKTNATVFPKLLHIFELGVCAAMKG